MTTQLLDLNKMIWGYFAKSRINHIQNEDSTFSSSKLGCPDKLELIKAVFEQRLSNRDIW